LLDGLARADQRFDRAAASGTATSGTATAAGLGAAAPTARRFFLNLGRGLRFGRVSAGGFEDDVEAAEVAEGRDESRSVELMGAEIVQDGPSVIEQRLGVDQIERPDPSFKDRLAGFEVLEA
jgi:hypothetical protein